MPVLKDEYFVDNASGTYTFKVNSYSSSESRSYQKLVVSRYRVGNNSVWEDFKGIRWRKPTEYMNGEVVVEPTGGLSSGRVFDPRWGDTFVHSFSPPTCVFGGYLSRVFFRPGWTKPQELLCLGEESSNLINRVLVEALNDVSLSDAGWGETVVMWRQTASMFINVASTMRKGIERFKSYWTRRAKSKKEFDDWWAKWSNAPDSMYMRQYQKYQARQAGRKKARKARKAERRKQHPSCWTCTASEKYLEMVYGWVPLISDLYASLELLYEEYKTSGVAFNITKGRRDETSKRLPDYGNQVNYTPMHPGFTWTWYDGSLVRTKHECNVSLWYILSDIRVARLSALGITNPAEIAWNVTRASFLIDWAVNVGGWLRSFTSTSGFEFLSGTMSYKRTVDETVASSNGKPGKGSGDVAPLRARVKASVFRREVYESQPVPGIPYKNPLSPTHVLNAVALLVSAFRK